jgi:hypothetical protein
MNTTEQIYAWFIESNPVPDPEVLDAEVSSPRMPLHVVDVVEVSTADRGVDRLRRKRWSRPTRHRRLAVVAAIVTTVLGVVAFGTVRTVENRRDVATGDSSLQVRFDGETCTYLGPERLRAGNVEVVASRPAGVEPFAIVVAMMTDGMMSIDDVSAWTEGRSAREIPPFVSAGTLSVGTPEEGATETTLTVDFTPGRFLITCNTAREGSDRAHPAVIVTVAP